MTTPDDYTGATLGQGTLSYESNPPRVQIAPRTYSIVKFSVGRVVDRYRLDMLSVSGDPVVLVLHRKSDNASCMHCLTANQCEHVAALREWMADQPEVAA